jgi:hypothetical protein
MVAAGAEGVAAAVVVEVELEVAVEVAEAVVAAAEGVVARPRSGSRSGPARSALPAVVIRVP